MLTALLIRIRYIPSERGRTTVSRNVRVVLGFRITMIGGLCVNEIAGFVFLCRDRDGPYAACHTFI